MNEAAASALKPRLLAALAASAALHAALLAALGASSAAPSAADARQPESPLHAVLRPEAPRAEPAATAPAPVREAARLPVTRYYKTQELDVRPGIMSRIEPEYPEAAARRFLSGKVVIRLFIDESGRVEHVATVRADPPGYFEDAAQRAFLAARFTPGMKRGKPVRAQMTLEVEFASPPPPGVPGTTS